MLTLGENISNYLLKNFGKEFLESYNHHINQPIKTYIRIPESVLDKDKLISELGADYSIKLKSIPNIKNVFSVESNAELIGKTYQFILGLYYIQSLSSMIPPLVLNPKNNDKVLDLCAAPGSKTTQLSEIMSRRGTLYANEPNPTRVRSLVHNLDKMKAINLGVLKYKGEALSRFYNNYFDKILVDAPCSSLGIVQKKDEVNKWWNEKQVKVIHDLQLKLLITAIKMLKPGGEIVYSTCSLSLEENEFVIKRVLDKYPVKLIDIELPVESSCGVEIETEMQSHEINKAKRILPWQINSEGFFVAKLVKIEGTEKIDSFYHSNKNYEFILDSSHKSMKPILEYLSDYYQLDKNIFNEFRYIIKKREIHFIVKDWESSSPQSFERIGTKFAKVDNKNIPHLNTHAAQIFGLNAKANCLELKSIPELKLFLSGGTIKNVNLPSGQKIVKYKNRIIGTGVSTQEGFKSRFPRSMRSQEIIYPNN